jgi:hypothetical protein
MAQLDKGALEMEERGTYSRRRIETSFCCIIMYYFLSYDNGVVFLNFWLVSVKHAWTLKVEMSGISRPTLLPRKLKPKVCVCVGRDF